MAAAGRSSPRSLRGWRHRSPVLRAPGTAWHAARSPRRTSSRTSPEAPSRRGAAGGALNGQVQGLHLARPCPTCSTPCFSFRPFPFLEIPRSCMVSRREPQNPENWNRPPETCWTRCRTGAARARGIAHVPNAGSSVSRYTSSPPPSTTPLRHNTSRGKFPKPRENAPLCCLCFHTKSRGARAGQVFV